MAWDGCVDRLDPAWNASKEKPEHITANAGEYDQPAGLSTSKDDE